MKPVRVMVGGDLSVALYILIALVNADRYVMSCEFSRARNIF